MSGAGNPLGYDYRDPRHVERYGKLVVRNPDGSTEGKHPRDADVDVMREIHEPAPLLRVIRAKCIDCSGGSESEARKCTAIGCALWPYRMASNPFRAPREMTQEQREAGAAPPGRCKGAWSVALRNGASRWRAFKLSRRKRSGRFGRGMVRPGARAHPGKSPAGRRNGPIATRRSGHPRAGAVSPLFDECFGQLQQDPRVAEGLVRRVVGRIQRMVDRGILPADGLHAQIAQVRDTAVERVELAQKIGQALAAGDRSRAQKLIEIGGVTFGYAVMLAAVEAQAREGGLATLRAAQDRYDPVEEALRRNGLRAPRRAVQRCGPSASQPRAVRGPDRARRGLAQWESELESGGVGPAA